MMGQYPMPLQFESEKKLSSPVSKLVVVDVVDV